MRTKRKNYKYDSSDYDNGDYNQDDFEGEEDDFDDEDQVEDSAAESDYDDSNNGNGRKNPSAKSKPSKVRNTKDQDEDVEDTYEDEDPFSPEIDQILADKQVEIASAQNTSQQNQQVSRNPRGNQIQSQTKTQNWFLIKFTDQSHLHIKWMEESKLEEYSYRAKQKIRRYWNAKEKKRLLQEQISRQAIQFKPQKNHHFSDDDEEEEEEDEDGAIKGLPLPIIPMVSDDIIEQEVIKQTHIKVEGVDGEDLTQYFDKNYAAVERLLSTTLLFPVIHPRQAKQIRGKWQDDCLKVVNVLANFRKNNVPIGLAFCEQLDTEKMYKYPQDFWNDLGLVFKNCRAFYKSQKRGLRKQCDALRCLAYHLYNSWYQEQKQRFITGVVEIPQILTDNNQLQQQQTLNLQHTDPAQLSIGKENPTTPAKDSTIVNLQSLLRGQQSGTDPLKKNQPQQQQQIQEIVNQQPSLQMVPNLQSQTPPPQQTQVQQQMPPPPSLPMLNSLQNQMQQSQTGNEMWEMNRQQQQPQMNQNLGGFQQFPNQQNYQQTPSLPSLNQLMMNPMNPAAQQNQINEQFQLQQLQQQLNQGYMPQNMNQMMQNPSYMGQQPQQEMMLQSNQMEWMQGLDKNIMKQFLGVSQPQIDPNTGNVQLPSLSGKGQQNFMQNPFSNLNQLQTQGQFMQQQSDQQSMMELNQIQALQLQQEKNINLFNQMMGLQMPSNNLQMQDNLQQQIAALSGQGMDMNQLAMRGMLGVQGQLPSLSQMPGYQQQNMGGGFQLPSLSQINQSIGSQLSTFDPYNNAQLMNMMTNPSFMNQLMNNGSNLQNMMKYQNFPSSAMNTAGGNSAYDEMSMMLGGFNQQIPSLQPGFNPFGSLDLAQNQAALMGLSNQYPGFNQNQMSMGQNSMNKQSQNNMFSKPSQLHPQQQTTRIHDPNLIQPDNLDLYNDKQQDPPVPPCIIDPGEYDLSWILESGESPQDIQITPYITEHENQLAINAKNNVDQLYLVKWKSLSYSQCTWEPESLLKNLFEEKIHDYNRFNRSLDQFQRDRLDQLIKNHKKMLRVTEKKYQTKRLDPMQEAYLSLQEARVNRQLLNAKIEEIMGQHFYTIVQYSEQKGIVPQFKKAHQQLKDYQILGLNWLIRAWHENRNVVLADEMGLGKTIMTLSLFDHLNKVYKLRGPYLILAPLTTLEHWKRIADEWTSLNSVLYYDPGSSEGRNEIRYWEWFYTDVTYKGQITQKSELYKFNIIITSFEVFMQDLNPLIQEIPFIYIVVDEAHRLKNKQAKTLKLLKDHPCKRILLLTGTPVQNNTKELWTLLNYIEPEKFDSLDKFLEQYGNLETYEQIQKLHTILKPHFLRRLKEEVDNSIPPLQETVIEVGLTTLQNTYYKGIYGENRMMLAKFGTNSIKSSQLNNIDIQLRKCCNHLFLLKGVEEELTRECRTEEDIYKKLLESSGKLMLLDKFIEKFKEENHKMLIFSQFKRMLDVIELYLKMKAIPYEKLTGSVKTQDRISAIQRFNDDKTFGVFLLTTRAGGLGINLTSARVVIIFDSDWNPQNDLQAIARAHRIGQKFEVQVYRLITSKTYEEQMFERASKKLGMEQALFSKGAFHQNEDIEMQGFQLRGITELKQDSKEIENLLKYGAYAFVGDEGNDDQANFNKDIDEILATGKKKEFTYSKGLYTLQKSTFNASKYESLPDVNDPDFWNKVLPYDSIISISVLEKKFKKEKKEMGKNEKLQKEFFKDLEIVFNDFIDAKFDIRTTVASKKQLEADEEKLREILKKMIRLSGIKLLYVEKCKEWLRDMLRTNKRKKPNTNPNIIKNQPTGISIEGIENDVIEEVDEDYQQIEEDDIIYYDSENEDKNRILRRRNPVIPSQQTKLDNDGLEQHVGKKRGRKPKNPQQPQQKQNASKDYEDSENYDQDDDDDGLYGEEEDKDYMEKGESKKKQQQQPQYDENYDDSDDEPEARYGLRAHRKRQKIGMEEHQYSQNQHNANNNNGFNQKNIPKMNDQFVKRNEKNGIVCAYCLHQETQANICIYFCQGYCQRFFHEECKETLFGNGDSSKRTQQNSRNNLAQWQCDDCLDNKAQCYCCKQKGQILLFPKKGKPKAAGQMSDQQMASMNLGDFEEEDQDDEIYNNGYEAINKIEEEEINDEIDLPQEEAKEEEDNSKEQQQDEAIPAKDQSDSSISGQNLKDYHSQQSLKKLSLDKKISIPLTTNALNENEENSHKEEIKESAVPLQKEISTKIVLSNIGPFTKPTSSSDLLEQKNVPQSPNPEPNDKRYVVRCTLGGCFKYYHVDCVYKNKNVSCINSMKVQRFRCPLHYCEICQASGDSILIVQCVTCPTAYHLKCLPQDVKAIRLTKKYIICGKHNMSQEDFPKYEEKSNVTTTYFRNNQSNNGGAGNGGNQGGLTLGNSAMKSNDKKKKRNNKMKRGRKPKQSNNFEYEEESGGEYEQEDYQTQQYNSKKEPFNSQHQLHQSSSIMIKIGEGSENQSNKHGYQKQYSSSSSIRGTEQNQPKPIFYIEKGRTNQGQSTFD